MFSSLMGKCSSTVKVKVKSLSRVRLFATPWTVACQAPLSMGFSMQEYWSRLPFPSPGDLPHPGIKPGSPALHADFLPSNKETACRCGRPGFNPWVGKIPWRRKWQPTPVFLPRESHGQRDGQTIGYSPRGHKESETTECALMRTCFTFGGLCLYLEGKFRQRINFIGLQLSNSGGYRFLWC